MWMRSRKWRRCNMDIRWTWYHWKGYCVICTGRSKKSNICNQRTENVAEECLHYFADVISYAERGIFQRGSCLRQHDNHVFLSKEMFGRRQPMLERLVFPTISGQRGLVFTSRKRKRRVGQFPGAIGISMSTRQVGVYPGQLESTCTRVLSLPARGGHPCAQDRNVDDW